MTSKRSSGARTPQETSSRARAIHRRDFINGVLMSVGGLALSRHLVGCGTDAKPADIPVGFCDGAIGTDPRVLRAANLPAAFNVAHWLRDGRLAFTPNSVKVAPLSCDDISGSHAIVDDTDTYDVIIVGSGLAGLASAFFLRAERPDARILILDCNLAFGGNAQRDDLAPIPRIASAGGAYCVDPYADFLTDFYTGIGVDWTQHYVEAPFYNYYFDDKTPFIKPGSKGWNLDTYRTGLTSAPYPDAILADLLAAREDMQTWYETEGAPTDPADNADPMHDGLAQITLTEYLTQTKGWSPAVADFYSRYTIDALGCTSDQCNAFSAISFIGAEYNPIFAFPGGTSGVARHAVKSLIPNAIAGGTTTADILQNAVASAELDRAGSKTRLRQAAMVVRADADASSASVVYWHGTGFHRAKAKAVIHAGQNYTARHVVSHLLDDAKKAAFRKMVHVPVVVANVALRSAKPLVDLGLGFNQYWWGSQFWADFTIADWAGPERLDPNRETVLTFFGGNLTPATSMASERAKLLSAPFSEYEASLREDLARVLTGAGADFDFDRDVSAVYLYRWGHGMLFPVPGYPFGPPQVSGDTTTRTPSFRHTIRAPLGRISFAGQDTEGAPSVECAVASGQRAAAEALAQL